LTNSQKYDILYTERKKDEVNKMFELFKVNTSAIEILHEMLNEAEIPHDFHDYLGGKRIAYPCSEDWEISCVQFFGSHGVHEGYIEALGLGCDTEPCSFENLFEKIQKDFQKPLTNHSRYDIIYIQ
jgi:hypothetical protein